MISTKAWFDFDIRNDPVFENAIRPFIEEQMREMAEYDRQRQALNPAIKYIFHEHAERAAQDVRHTAARLGQPPHVQEAMYWAMLPHDIGKKTLPVEIWDSEEKPTGEVKAFRRSHAERGLVTVAERLEGIDHPFIELMKDVMANHHKTMFQEGPDETLEPQDISLPVRLCCIVEGYDGYTIPRPHHSESDFTPDKVIPRALDKMRNEPDKGAKMFDMDMFEVFAAMKLEALKPASPAFGAPGPFDKGIVR